MTKFFLKKGDGKGHMTHSQIMGTVWISVILLLFAGLVIFLPKKNSDTPPEVSTMVADTSFLTKKKDSAYHQRGNNYSTSQKRPRKSTNRHIESETSVALRESFDSIRPAKRKKLVVELNSADTLTLQLLHGIGPKLAPRIVEYRERLGGFRKVEQLLEVYGIDAELLAELAPHLTIDTSAVRSMEINSLSLKQLLRHPYIEYYQARDIVRLRNSGVMLESADDLKAIPSMTDSTLQQLLPYVRF